MNAVVMRSYGGPEVLGFEEVADPVAGAGEVLVRVVAASINPIDVLRRSGKAAAFAPVVFPGVIGVDVAGEVAAVGAGVQGFSLGERVFAMASGTYAELCVVKAGVLAKIPGGMDTAEAAALPLVMTTGYQLIEATGVGKGQTVLVTGAMGGVGRSAVYAAKLRGATVIAGVLTRHLPEAKGIGADRVVATDDAGAMAGVGEVDAVANTVRGAAGDVMMGKVKGGGVFASVVGPPANAGAFPGVRVAGVFARADAGVLHEMAAGVAAGKLEIPIGRRLPLRQAGDGHVVVEKGGSGKVLLLA